jgi:hypothetical protein
MMASAALARWSNPMSDLSSQLAGLETRFRQIANQHLWLCLAIPPRTGSHGSSPCVGEKFDPPWPQLGSLGVRDPQNPCLQPIVDYVNTLTHEAHELLFAVLAGPNRIPPDVADDIRGWEQQRYGFGWVRWLWFATRVQHVHRLENYAQVAADALHQLGKWHSPEQQLESESKGRPNTDLQTKPNHEQSLNDTELNILKHCRNKAHKGERIASHLGLSYDHTRRVLARLIRTGRLRKTNDGYRTVKVARRAT